MTVRAAPYFPQSQTSDGVTTDWTIPFTFLDPTHVNVTVGTGAAAVLKVLGTDYVILNASSGRPIYTTWTVGVEPGQSILRWLSGKIPSNATVFNLFRNTPIARPGPANKLQMGPDTALYAHFRFEELSDLPIQIPFFISATALAAHTAQVFTMPCDGYITGLETEVTEVITTGGTVGANVESTAVAGMVVTVANSAAAGKTQTAVPTTQQSTTTIAKKGQQISVTNASFATAGALSGFVTIQPADLASYG